jgi:hypothetical protein
MGHAAQAKNVRRGKPENKIPIERLEGQSQHRLDRISQKRDRKFEHDGKNPERAFIRKKHRTRAVKKRRLHSHRSKKGTRIRKHFTRAKNGPKRAKTELPPGRLQRAIEKQSNRAREKKPIPRKRFIIGVCKI